LLGKILDMVKENFVAVCADDFGLSHGVSLGILQALAAGRLTAVSALTTGSCWPAAGPLWDANYCVAALTLILAYILI